MLNLNEIKQLIDKIDESTISEFSYEKDDVKIKIKKSNSNQTMVQPMIQHVPEMPQMPTLQQESKAKVVTDSEMIEDKEQREDADIEEIVSPMVGTFYRKPSPESDNYVDIGDQINEETVVCIVEAMKLFNEIEAETSGEIVDVLVEDGELVEYGQPLFKVKTN